MKTLKKGSKGDEVKLLQKLLVITADGEFGQNTEKAVKAWQRKNKLVDDGVVGTKSWEKFAELFSIDKSVIWDPLAIHTSLSWNRDIKYIVIHYTAGFRSTSGSAKATKKVFESRNASADFVVDNADIVQMNPDLNNQYTWAVGDALNNNTGGGSKHKLCTNRNSISIEMCSTLSYGSAKYPNHDGWRINNKVLENTVNLVKILMQKFNIPVENVIRHYDVTGKLCPGVIGWNDGRIRVTTGGLTIYYNSSDNWEYFKDKLK